METVTARACLKIHSRHPYAPLCGRFAPYSVAVARYSALMRNKSPTNCDAHLIKNIFRTRSKEKPHPVSLWHKMQHF